MNVISHSIQIPSATTHLQRVRQFVQECAEQAGLPTNEVGEVKMAVDEACSNVMEHAYQGDPSNELEVEISIKEDQFEVTIRDRGIAFDLESYREPEVKQLVEHRQSGGLGVYLIQQLMDNVEYTQKGSVNEVHLVKYLNSSG